MLRMGISCKTSQLFNKMIQICKENVCFLFTKPLWKTANRLNDIDLIVTKKKSISRLGATVNAGRSILNDQWVYVILETPRISIYTTISLKWSTSRGHSKNNGSGKFLTPFTPTPLVTCATFCILIVLVFNIIRETSRFLIWDRLVTLLISLTNTLHGSVKNWSSVRFGRAHASYGATLRDFMGFTFCQKFKGLSLSSHVNHGVVLVRTCQRQIFATIMLRHFT